MKTDKCKQPGVFRYISLGDVHLGHLSTPTELIIRNLERLLCHNTLKELDMLIITGDLFDHQLLNGSDTSHEIERWMTSLMMACATYDVQLRIVEGTPSHDRLQPKYFVEQQQNANIPVDLFYGQKLCIEYNAKLDAHFLYVPDKWRPTTEITLSEVRQLLKQHGLEKVDFAIMHGAFEYQYPEVVLEPTHCSETYLELVKYHILIGHVHIQNPRGRIFPAGSFDRLSHGDEIPKGLFLNTVREDGEFTSKFIENKGAKRYVTLNVHGQNTMELYNTIKTEALVLPKHSAIRLRCNSNDIATGDINTFMTTYPEYLWTIDPQRPDTKKKKPIAESLKDFDMSDYIDITPEYISELLCIEIGKHTEDPILINNCLNRLKEFL